MWGVDESLEAQLLEELKKHSDPAKIWDQEISDVVRMNYAYQGH